MHIINRDSNIKVKRVIVVYLERNSAFLIPKSYNKHPIISTWKPMVSDHKTHKSWCEYYTKKIVP